MIIAQKKRTTRNYTEYVILNNQIWFKDVEGTPSNKYDIENMHNLKKVFFEDKIYEIIYKHIDVLLVHEIVSNTIMTKKVETFNYEDIYEDTNLDFIDEI